MSVAIPSRDGKSSLSRQAYALLLIPFQHYFWNFKVNSLLQDLISSGLLFSILLIIKMILTKIAKA